jgi:KDO2-lipid IV(A) lauroyltransferase
MQFLAYCLALPWIYLVSILPFPVLYALSDALYFMVFHVIGYRKNIVLKNLTSAFPEKSPNEILKLRKEYYHWFCDLILESFKTLTISREQMLKHCTMSESASKMFNDYFDKGQQVIIVMGHFGNWEWAGNTFSLLQKHQLYVIYLPLKNKYFSKLITSMRTRFGTKLIPMRDTSKQMLLNRNSKPGATAFIADQTPPPDRAHWMTFMRQDTPVYQGTEKLAQKLNYPVIYTSVRRLKRGYYTLEAEVLFEHPAGEPENKITEAHTQRLEKDIMSQPATWLWSHRRWKHKRPLTSTASDSTAVAAKSKSEEVKPSGKRVNIFSGALYYLILMPLSRASFGVLRAVSTTLYFVIYKVFGYRKKVVQENLRRSFPDKSSEELLVIEKKFFRHLCDVILDGIKVFSISKDDLRAHLTCVNPEVIRKHYDAGQSVIIAVGHYNSWELFLTGVNLFVRHRAVVIYQPLSNEFLDRKLREKRSEYRTILLPAKDVKAFFRSPGKEPTATVFAIDQSPGKPESCYWMNFLNQETGVLFGTEKYAKDYNQPVYYARIKQERRSHYTLEFVEVTTEPTATSHGEITEKVTRLLEGDIRNQPELWLWSHRRWKHKKPVAKSVSS